jgi:flavin reductase (DIM6/NTAB) family NADH-FMN oxidoreductase RutF
VRAVLRRLSLLAGRVPRYVTVGEPNPQRRVRVMLEGFGPPRDVTHTHVVASLRPLCFVTPDSSSHTGSSGPGVLRFSSADEARTLGTVDIVLADPIATDGGPVLQVFRATGSSNACLRGIPATVFERTHARAERRRDPPPTFWIDPADMRALQVVYIPPRPVLLVSVQHGDASNLFPMDLVGAVAGHFVLALRSTSPSIPLMTESGRFTLADVPLDMAPSAQRLGVHHKHTSVDWHALPFATDRSAGHGLRVPRAALRVRDVVVQHAQPVGSHMVFVTRVVHDERREEGLQMAGVSGSYYRYLRLRGIHLPLASVAPPA